MKALARYFEFEKLGTGFRQETLAGLTTFMTLAYIIVVNPKILEAAGLPIGASMTATILTAFVGTLLMGVYARRPFAIAPYMGQNAFVAYTLVKGMGYPWQVVLGTVFVAAALFAVLTMMKVRGWLANAIPLSIRIGLTAGIGFFLAFIGLNESGIVTLGVPGAPVQVGNLARMEPLLSIVTFLLIATLMIRKVNGAILIGILSITVTGLLCGLIHMPEDLLSFPPALTPILGKLDITGAMKFQFLPVILTIFILLFVDTMGTLVGLSHKAGFLDGKGNLPQIEKPMLCDSIATMAGAWMGTTPSGAYLESAAGIEAGGRSGFASLVTAGLFLVALFFSPLLTLVPPYGYAPALVIVGLLMMSGLKDLDTGEPTELLPPLIMVALISFTYNLGMGMSAGFLAYAVLKLVSGKSREVPLGMWVLAGLSLLFFVFYPYS